VSHTRLAAFICGYSTVTIVISGNYGLNSFKEDLQKMYRRAGLKGEGLLFLLTDSQVMADGGTFGRPPAGTAPGGARWMG
jgi:dynein heavy chain